MTWNRALGVTAVEELSLTDIQERMNAPEEDIMRLAHSLSCAKYKILNKSPASRTVTKTDVFSMNTKFTDKMRRIRVSRQAICTGLHCINRPFQNCHSCLSKTLCLSSSAASSHHSIAAVHPCTL